MSPQSKSLKVSPRSGEHNTVHSLVGLFEVRCSLPHLAKHLPCSPPLLPFPAPPSRSTSAIPIVCGCIGSLLPVSWFRVARKPSSHRVCRCCFGTRSSNLGLYPTSTRPLSNSRLYRTQLPGIKTCNKVRGSYKVPLMSLSSNDLVHTRFTIRRWSFNPDFSFIKPTNSNYHIQGSRHVAINVRASLVVAGHSNCRPTCVGIYALQETGKLRSSKCFFGDSNLGTIHILPQSASCGTLVSGLPITGSTPRGPPLHRSPKKGVHVTPTYQPLLAQQFCGFGFTLFRTKRPALPSTATRTCVTIINPTWNITHLATDFFTPQDCECCLGTLLEQCRNFPATALRHWGCSLQDTEPCPSLPWDRAGSSDSIAYS